MKTLGILNITKDSFSDGGLYLEAEKALEKAVSLKRNGADVIDIGAQSSNLESTQISPQLEWDRIEPVIKILKSKRIPISVDTYKPYVIRKCLDAGVNYINNINSFRDDESLKVLQEFERELPELILMYSHNQGDQAAEGSPLNTNTILDDIFFFFEKQIKRFSEAGIDTSKIIFDPGMGLFLGEDPELSFAVLRNIKKFKEKFGKTLVSVSRKSFLGNALGGLPPIDRNHATLSAEIYLFSQGIDFIRTHDALALKHARIIWERISGIKN